MRMKPYPDLRNHFLGTDFRDVPGHDSVVECVEHQDQAEVHPVAIEKNNQCGNSQKFLRQIRKIFVTCE